MTVPEVTESHIRRATDSLLRVEFADSANLEAAKLLVAVAIAEAERDIDAKRQAETEALTKMLNGFFGWLDEQEAKSSAEAGRAFRRAFADLQRRLRGAIHRKLKP